MTDITGAIKFFEKSYALFKDGASAVVSSGDITKNYMLTDNKYFAWLSDGSDDSTMETIEITLPTPTTINRLFLNNINLKEFEIDYYNGSTYENFTNVSGIDNSTVSGIEAVVNGDFTNWTADDPDNWNLSIPESAPNYYITENPSGNCQYINATGVAFRLTQTALTIGELYSYSVDINTIAIPGQGIRFFDTGIIIDEFTTVGTHTGTYTATTTSLQIFKQQAGLSSDVIFDNISFKAISSIKEGSFDKSTAYYAFDAVSAEKIRIKAYKTQIADQEKQIGWVVPTEEIGTLLGYPEPSIRFDRNARIKETLSGRKSIQKSYDILDSCRFRVRINSFTEDQQIYEGLHDRETGFLIWLCGGVDADVSNGYRFKIKGWGLDDLIFVQTNGKIDSTYYKNIYKSVSTLSLTLQEVISG
jgi:hypothetical protein